MAKQTRDEADDFRQLAEEKRVGLLVEFWQFLKENKKWWLAPIVITVLFLGLLVLLSGSAAAPFIYTLF